MPTILESQIQAGEQEWLDKWKQGPKRLRWTRLPLQVGDRAPDLELQDLNGQVVHLRDFWSKSPALLLFWRHFGCSCGIDRARRLQSEYADYINSGATVVVIGQGEPERSTAYSQNHKLPCQVLCDPNYRAYETYDLLEGKPSQILFDAGDEMLQCDLDAGMKQQRSRHGTERASVDSPWQLPGEFVVDPSGIIRLAYRYQYCEDWPNPLVLIAAIKEAVWESK